MVRRICLSDLPTCLGTLNQRRAWPTFLRHPIAQTDFGGTGISTSCPSPTAFALSLLIPAFSLLYAPHVLTVLLQRIQYAPLPLRSVHSIPCSAELSLEGHLTKLRQQFC